MGLRLAVAAVAVSLALACAKRELAGPPPAPRSAVQPAVAEKVQPVPATKTEDPSIVADCERAKKLLDDWQGDNRQLEESRKLILSVLARDREYAPAYIALSRLERKAAYQSYDNYDPEGLRRAEKFIEHALKIAPKSAEAYMTLAWTEMAEKDFDRANASLDTAEQLGARSADVRAARAEIAFDQSDSKTALELSKQTIGSSDASAKDRAGAYGLMASIYGRLGALDEADRAYQEQLKMAPGDAWSHGNYAQFLLGRGRVDDAIRYAARAVQLMPYPMGFFTLGQAYLAKANQLWDDQQYDAAAAYIDKTTAIAGGNAGMYYNLGVFYERAWRRTSDSSLLARARAAYQKTLELKPDHASARKALERLAQ